MQNGIQLLTQINRYLKSRLAMYLVQRWLGYYRVKTKACGGGWLRKGVEKHKDSII